MLCYCIVCFCETSGCKYDKICSTLMIAMYRLLLTINNINSKCLLELNDALALEI